MNLYVIENPAEAPVRVPLFDNEQFLKTVTFGSQSIHIVGREIQDGYVSVVFNRGDPYLLRTKTSPGYQVVILTVLETDHLMGMHYKVVKRISNGDRDVYLITVRSGGVLMITSTNSKGQSITYSHTYLYRWNEALSGSKPLLTM